MSAPYRSYVLVSRDQIARNFRAVSAVVGPRVEVAAVVKADAYGHGALEVARVVVAEGARWLAVSSVEEGVTLRQSGIAARILVMGGFLPYESEALTEFDLTPAVHSLDQMAQLNKLSEAAGKPIATTSRSIPVWAAWAPALRPRDPAALANAPHAHLEGLMTHFASAADYTKSQTDEQLAYFGAMRAQLREAGVNPRYLHTSSTIPVGYGRQAGWHQMVRAGHALYGYVSPARGDAPPQLLDVKPALTWKAKLMAVKICPRARWWVMAARSGHRAPCASACWEQATRTAFFTACRIAAE